MPQRPQPSVWAWIAAAVAIVVIRLQVESIVRVDPIDDDPPIQIGAGGDDDRGETPTRSLQLQLVSFAIDYASGTIDLPTLRDRLVDVRVDANLILVDRAARSRIRWLGWLQRVLDVASLAALVLLAGPLWLKRNGVEGAWRSWPAFAVASAALLVVGNGVVRMVIGLEELEISVASYGSPAASAADAALHYLVYGNDAEVDRVLQLVVGARDAAIADPWSSAGV